MSNSKKQPKNLVRKVDTHKVTSGAAGKKKAATERLKRAEKKRDDATQAILVKKEAATVAVTPLSATPKRTNASKAQQNRKVAQSSGRLVAASPAIHAVAAATTQRQTQSA